jgi:uncharacterized membrane protein YkoI
MFSKFASLTCRPRDPGPRSGLLTPSCDAAQAQSRDERQQTQSQPQPRQPRVSPDEARRRGGEAVGGRPIDTRPRRDGDYSVLVERDGRVREVVVDGQTGRTRDSGSSNNQRRRPD